MTKLDRIIAEAQDDLFPLFGQYNEINKDLPEAIVFATNEITKKSRKTLEYYLRLAASTEKSPSLTIDLIN